MRHVRFFSVKTPLLLSGVSLVRFFPLVERNEHKTIYGVLLVRFLPPQEENEHKTFCGGSFGSFYAAGQKMNINKHTDKSKFEKV